MCCDFDQGECGHMRIKQYSDGMDGEGYAVTTRMTITLTKEELDSVIRDGKVTVDHVSEVFNAGGGYGGDCPRVTVRVVDSK